MPRSFNAPIWQPLPLRPIQQVSARRRLRHRAARRQWLPVGLLIVLAVATFALGSIGMAAIRPIFVLACVGIGVVAWRAGPARHLEIALALLIISPFLRRVVDLHAGYEPAGLMLVGPLLFILVPVIDLRPMLRPGADGLRHYGPVVLFILCILYGCMLSLFQADFNSAASGALKSIAPALYGVWLAEQARKTPGMLDAATRTFAILTPIMGIYGFMQYVNPPDWDRFWMIYSRMTSIGNPVPYEIRVFSIMNSPASLATFTVAGLLLFGFCRPGWTAALLAIPSCLGLMLSLYRTAWVALAFGVIFCVLFSATRMRALLITCCITLGIAVAVIATPFGDVISDRLETLNKPSEDGSGQERMQEYVTLWNTPDSMMFGTGFGSADPGSPGTMPVDGMIVASWLSLGIVVGLLSIASVVWAALQALNRVRERLDRESVALGAIIVGTLAQIPLASITSGELGILFWMAVGLTAATPSASRSFFRSAETPSLPHLLHLRPNPRWLAR